MRYLYHFEMPIGRISLVEDKEEITNLYFETDLVLSASDFFGVHRIEKTSLLAQAEQQLWEYFSGERRAFDLPLRPEGSAFMLAVWEELRKIPYGETASYGEIAMRVGSPSASRAVGLANNKNPLPIFYPCHRIVGRDGKLVGYRGGLEIKRQLLALERKYK